MIGNAIEIPSLKLLADSVHRVVALLFHKSLPNTFLEVLPNIPQGCFGDGAVSEFASCAEHCVHQDGPQSENSVVHRATVQA